MSFRLATKLFGKVRRVTTGETITLAVGFLFLLGFLVSVVSGRPQESRENVRNNLSHFAARSLSRTKVLVWIRYEYIGDRGKDNIWVSATALGAGGSQYPDTTYGVTPIRVGEGTASLEIPKRHGRTPGTSERIRICLQEGTTGKPFYCESYPYKHSWSDNLAGEPPARNEIGGFSFGPSISNEMSVRVQYAYTGDYGTNNIRMVAFPLRDNGARVHNTDPVPTNISPGYGHVTLRIRKGPGYVPMTGDKWNICMLAREGRLFSCHEMKY
jgi:hypothetical protein